MKALADRSRRIGATLFLDMPRNGAEETKIYQWIKYSKNKRTVASI
jgi:hypothetical protein